MSAGAAAATNQAFEDRVNHQMHLAKFKPEATCSETLAILVNFVALVVLIAGIKLCCQSDFNYPALSIGFTASGGGVLLLTLALWIIGRVFPSSLEPARKEAAIRSMAKEMLLIIRYMDPECPYLPQTTKNKTITVAYTEYLHNCKISKHLVGGSRLSEIEHDVNDRLAQQLGITIEQFKEYGKKLMNIIAEYDRQAPELRNQARQELNANASGPHGQVQTKDQVEIQALVIFHRVRR